MPLSPKIGTQQQNGRVEQCQSHSIGLCCSVTRVISIYSGTAAVVLLFSWLCWNVYRKRFNKGFVSMETHVIYPLRGTSREVFKRWMCATSDPLENPQPSRRWLMQENRLRVRDPPRMCPSSTIRLQRHLYGHGFDPLTTDWSQFAWSRLVVLSWKSGTFRSYWESMLKIPGSLLYQDVCVGSQTSRSWWIQLSVLVDNWTWFRFLKTFRLFQLKFLPEVENSYSESQKVLTTPELAFKDANIFWHIPDVVSMSRSCLYSDNFRGCCHLVFWLHSWNVNNSAARLFPAPTSDVNVHTRSQHHVTY